MAERKSNFTGERYGAYVVVSRVEKREDWMLPGKRYWLVEHDDKTQKIVLQTELKDLGKAPKAPSAPKPVAPQGPTFPDDGWANDAPVGELEYFSETDAEPVHHSLPPNVEIPPPGPDTKYNEHGQRVHGESDPIVVRSAGEIAASVIQANKDWAASLPVEEIEEMPVRDDEKHGGLGESAEASVSEAELDARAAAAGNDPLRAAVRKLMGEVHALREQLALVGTQADYVMELVDSVMREAVIR